MLSVIICVGLHMCEKWRTNDDVFYEDIIYKTWAYCLCIEKNVKPMRYITIYFLIEVPEGNK